MTAFFVGGLDSRDVLAEQAYGDLRALSQDLAGRPARMRRIFKIGCRMDGHDQDIEVGKPVASGGSVVSAILDHGREEAFIVHTTPSGDGVEEPLRVPNPVYSVTEFSAGD